MSGPEGLIVIASALPEEFEAIARAASCTRRGKPTAGFSSSGRLGGASVRLILTGVGPARAAALSAFEGISGSSAVIGAGVCGSISAGLSPGEILVSSRILDDSGEAPAPSAGLVSRAVAAGASPATFVTVSKPLVSSNEKREAAERLRSGGPVAAAVDMESAAWARAATRLGVPYVILRAVADTFEESLPSFLADCVDGSGSIDRARVARLAAVRPESWPSLLAMRARVRAASAGLAAFLGRFLAGGLARA
jgi:adenosylhomocysteine nucleosidase